MNKNKKCRHCGISDDTVKFYSTSSYTCNICKDSNLANEAYNEPIDDIAKENEKGILGFILKSILILVAGVVIPIKKISILFLAIKKKVIR